MHWLLSVSSRWVGRWCDVPAVSTAAVHSLTQVVRTYPPPLVQCRRRVSIVGRSRLPMTTRTRCAETVPLLLTLALASSRLACSRLTMTTRTRCAEIVPLLLALVVACPLLACSPLTMTTRTRRAETVPAAPVWMRRPRQLCRSRRRPELSPARRCSIPLIART